MNDVPKLQDYMLPVLKFFADGEEHSFKDIPPYLEFNYSLLQSDKPKRSRLMINGSIGYFIKALVLDKTGTQKFKITNRGLAFFKQKSEKITVEDLRQFNEFDEFIQSRYKKVEKIEPDSAAESIPEDAIDSAYQVHKENLADELIDKLKQGTWQFFEMLVKDLLVAMGYGDPHDESHLTPRSADGGIDGIIKEDKLGLDIICIQAKKWDNPVGRPELQKFSGSLETEVSRFFIEVFRKL